MKIKLTKGELKKQRDDLRRYYRYLPTLQLKKQQLQVEIAKERAALDEKIKQEAKESRAAEAWAGLLIDAPSGFKKWIKPSNILRSSRNIAGVEVPAFERCEFPQAEYDLFETPLWVDHAIDSLREIVSSRVQIAVAEEAVARLREELRITTQRVNLFEKVKIPQAEEAIRLIKIYLGDQMANAVGRSKIAKQKIEKMVLEEASAWW
jgi:V/A-type H+-transporting ATPase subunit D